jgi:hypothetical protein
MGIAHAHLRSVSRCTALHSLASADSASEFEAAREKWRSADLTSYSFIYEWGGGVVIAPRCADAKIHYRRVRDSGRSIPAGLRLHR